MKSNCFVCKIVGGIAAIGAINWGLVGILHKNVVTHFLGEMTRPTRGVYALIGLAGIIMLLSFVKECPACKKA